MMKKQLLTTALMLTSIIASTSSIEAKSSMDGSLRMLWMNTDMAMKGGDIRQGFGMGGKFYLQNRTTQLIEIWDETGKINEIPSGKGTNITFDDAGNIIVRLGVFPNKNDETINEMRIISAKDHTIVKDIPLKKITTGRVDFWGHVKGNVLDETTGGILYTGTQYQQGIIEVPIVNGEQNVGETINDYPYFSPFGVPGQFATTSLISAWDDDEAISILSPAINKTNCNSIQKLIMDDDGSWVHDSYYITPRHNSCTGYYIFKIGTQRYIVYSSGDNNADGFTVSRLATKATSPFETSDETVRIATKYAEATEAGIPMYPLVGNTNTYYGSHFSVEVISATQAYIYQYYPGGYIAKYEFTPPTVGVKDTQANKVAVIGGNGEITIEGEASSINVYTIQGVAISRNQSNVKCLPGIYLVKIGNETTKVVVR